MISPEAIWRHLDGLTKPPRSLGRLEQLAARLAELQQVLQPLTQPRRLVLFAADHGVTAAGVSAWPASITRSMIDTIRAGKSASAVLAASTNTELVLVDVGSFENQSTATEDELPDRVTFRSCRLQNGTRNLNDEPAMTVTEFEAALDVGRREARFAAGANTRVVAAGEMGIGNSTIAACLAMLLADVPMHLAVGPGAGTNASSAARKRDVVQKAVARAHVIAAGDRLGAIASVCGLEVAAMAGFFLEACECGMTIVLDGYIATAAALIAEHLRPGTAHNMIAAHQSAEPGHVLTLEYLRLTPFLNWELRLGEGTGALLFMPLLDAAAGILGRMASLAELEIQPTPCSS